MSGIVTRGTQQVPITTSVTQGTGEVTSSATPLDGANQIPFILLLDETNPAAKVPLAKMAQDGTDSSDGNATQATAGVGIRGWLSTLVSLFRAGTAKVLVREVAQTQINVGQLNVGTGVTLIRAAAAGRNVLTVRNISGIAGIDVFIGSSVSMTPSTGFPLYAASRDALDTKWTGALYGVTASGTATMAYYEEIA